MPTVSALITWSCVIQTVIGLTRCSSVPVTKTIAKNIKMIDTSVKVSKEACCFILMCCGVILLAIPSCPAKSVELVHYQTLLAPINGSKSVTVQCADNAHIRDGSNLTVSCGSDGSWSGTTPECECDNGYRPVPSEQRQICEGVHTIVE